MKFKRKNFTLIELVVVMAILMLLGGLAGPRFFNMLDEAKWKTAGTQVKNLRSIVDTYRMDKNTYPSSLENLLEKNQFGNTYFSEEYIPKDPWGKDYIYSTGGSGTKAFDIVSYGADGVQGGEGINKDISCWDDLSGNNSNK